MVGEVGTSDNAAGAGSGASGAGASGGSGGSSSGSSRSDTASAAVARAVTAASSAAQGNKGNSGVPADIVKAANPGAQPAAKTAQPAQAQPGAQAKPGEAGAADAGAAAVKPEGEAAATGAEGAAAGEGAADSRYKIIARNVRSSTVKQIRTALGLKEGETTAHVRRDLDLVRNMRSDTVGFAKRLFAELSAKGVDLGQGGVAGNENRAAAAGGGARTFDKEPEPNLVSEDGKYKTYDSERMRDVVQYHVQSAIAQLRGELDPDLEFIKGARTEQETAQIKQRASALASSALQQARSFPHFKENEPEIAKRLLAMNPEVREQIGPIAAMHIAYNSVMRDVVLPGISRTAESKVRDEMQRKANASAGSVVPGGGNGGNKVPALRNVKDLAAHMESLSAKAEAGVAAQ